MIVISVDANDAYEQAMSAREAKADFCLLAEGVRAKRLLNTVPRYERYLNERRVGGRSFFGILKFGLFALRDSAFWGVCEVCVDEVREMEFKREGDNFLACFTF